MKKLFILLSFCFGLGSASAQETLDTRHVMKDSHHNLIGYIQRDGSIRDERSVFKGQFKRDETVLYSHFKVLDKNHKLVGYILNEREVQDAAHKPLGFIRFENYDCIIEDKDHKILGYVKNSGEVEDASHNVIAYQEKTEPMWSGPYFFLFNLNK